MAVARWWWYKHVESTEEEMKFCSGSFSSIIYFLVSTFCLPKLIVIVIVIVGAGIIRDRHIFTTFWAYLSKKDASAVRGELFQQAPYKHEPKTIRTR